MSTPTVTQSQPVGLTGGVGYRQRIQAWCSENGVEMTRAKARRFGERMYRRAQAMQGEFDFYESLRVLGIHTDSTARDAIKNIDRSRSHKE